VESQARERPSGRRRDVLNEMTSVVEADCIDGDLVVAGGVELLVERVRIGGKQSASSMHGARCSPCG
jgi:hypothetical protein